jgi:hypothetical protein
LLTLFVPACVLCRARRRALPAQPVQVDEWLAAQQPYDVRYAELFEVHAGVAVKQGLPAFSEAFRGYGLNKQQHAWHAAQLGFTFKVGLCVPVQVPCV